MRTQSRFIGLPTLIIAAVTTTIAALRAQEGALDPSFTPPALPATSVQLAVSPDGKVYHMKAPSDGVTPSKVARLNADGTEDATFATGAGAQAIIGTSTFPANVHALAIQADGKVLVGGDFTRYNGVDRRFLTRLNPDGSVDTSFNIGSGFSSTTAGSVKVLKVSGSTIYAGGQFTGFNGTPRNVALVRLNLDGSLDTSFAGTTISAGASVSELTIQPDGKLLIIAAYASGTTATLQLYRLNANGGLDPGFQTGVGTPFGGSLGLFHGLQPNGKILLSGSNGNYNGAAVNKSLFRLNSDGTLDTGFVPPTFNANAVISRFIPLSDEKVLIKGNFTTVAGSTRAGIARLNQDLTLDPAFVPPSNLFGHSGITIDSQGRVHVSAFWFVGATPTGSVFRLSGPAQPDIAAGSLDGHKLKLTGETTPSLIQFDTATFSWRFEHGASLEGTYTYTKLSPTTARAVLVTTHGSMSETDRIELTYQTTGTGTFVDNWGPTGSETNLITGQFVIDPPVTVPPTIFEQPINQVIAAGATVFFSSIATGDLPLSYQWFHGTTALAGQTEALLVLTNVQPSQAGNYSLKVTNAAGEATSATATLTVNEPASSPVISQGPQSQTVNLGANVTFSVTATGTAPLNYQWFKIAGTATNAISGATNPSLTLNNVQSTDAGTYFVRVSNALGTVVSGNATLTVDSAATPPQITQGPESQSVNVGANVTFSVTATGTAPLAYQWRKDGNAISGATSASLTLNNVQTSNAGSYSVLVGNSAGSAVSGNATLTVNVPASAPQITQAPQNRIVTAGETAVFTVTATGTSPLAYQWQKNEANIAGAVSASLILTGVQASDAGSYRVVVSNSAGTATSSAATLTVNPVSDRALEVTDVRSTAEGDISATIQIAALGNEHSIAFTLGYNAQALANPQVQLLTVGGATLHSGAGRAQLSAVPAGTALTTDTSTNGQIGVVVTLPGVQTLAAGEQDIVTVTFDAAPGTTPAQAQLGFTGQPNIADANGAQLAAQAVVEPTTSVGAFPGAPDNQSGLFEQTLTISNPSNAQYPGVRVMVRDLPADTATNIVRVANAHGSIIEGTNTVPYFDFGAIAAGGSVDFTVELYIQNRRPATVPPPRYEVMVQTPPTILISPTFMVSTNATRIVEGNFFAEFATQAGRIYYVQYNSDLTATNGWKTSLPALRGTGAQVQWIDNGPPRTESSPASVPARFYRVVGVQ